MCDDSVAFNFDTYFTNEFTIENFYDAVDSLLAELSPNMAEEPIILEPKRRKTECSNVKKPKKNYAMQINDLKQEIKELRQEIEIRDTQLLSLIKQKH